MTVVRWFKVLFCCNGSSCGFLALPELLRKLPLEDHTLPRMQDQVVELHRLAILDIRIGKVGGVRHDGPTLGNECGLVVVEVGVGV